MMDFSICSKYILDLCPKLMAAKLPDHTLINVNIPAIQEQRIKGIKVVRHGMRQYIDRITKQIDPQGRTWYWQGGELLAVEEPQDTDVAAVEAGYVSVTPVHLDMTAYGLLAGLQGWAG